MYQFSDLCRPLRNLPRIALFACSLIATLNPGPADAADLKLATSSSTVSSGLMGVILPEFEAASGLSVEVLAVGTGNALKLGRDGLVDVLLVHAPQAENDFVEAGHGVLRRDVMANDFVVVGPKDDPAGVRQASDAGDAFRRIAENRAGFISRGDDSGTNKMERRLWASIGIEPYGLWYREVGMNMGDTLGTASELQSYTLSDRGTWLALREGLSLELLGEDRQRLANPYHVIAINPDQHPQVNFEGARLLIDWLVSPAGQSAIGAYRVGGQVLFSPTAN